MLHLGRPATEDEIAAWDIDIRPDGMGLPEGKGTVADGEVLYTDNCAVCHGDFGEAVDRWPVLAGGHGSLTAERPEKTIGSYWPYLSTIYDYVHRAMPFGGARTLSDDDVYAITAYLLYLNDVVTDEEFELSKENFASVRLPNEANFIDDNRAQEPHNKAGAEPCMNNCKPEPAEVKMRARILDVTPDVADDEDNRKFGGRLCRLNGERIARDGRPAAMRQRQPHGRSALAPALRFRALLALSLLCCSGIGRMGLASRGNAVQGLCQACHEIGEGAKHKVGPHLDGIVGRTAGEIEGFKFSERHAQGGQRRSSLGRGSA